MARSYPLEKLSDQIAHNETITFNFIDKGTPSSAELQVVLQWVHSKSLFYTDIIDMTDKELKKNRQLRQSDEDKLKDLYGVTPSTARIMPVKVNFASVTRFEEIQPKLSGNEATLGGAIKGNSASGKASMTISMILVVVSLLTSLIKPQFIDVIDCLTI